MQTDFEQAVEIAKNLPVDERRRLREWLEEQERETKNRQDKDERLQKDIARYKKAREWINENSEKYMNQWVCLDGNRLIAHGADGLEVDRRAKAAGIKTPFLHHIVDESLPFGGW